MSLYNLEKYGAQYQALENMSEEFDPEVLDDTLEAIFNAGNEEVDKSKFVIKNTSADINAIDAEIKDLQRRKNSKVNFKKAYLDAIKFYLESTGQKSTDNFRLQMNGGKIPVIIDDESIIDEDFLVAQPPKVDKDLIRAQLESGEEIPGARLGERGMGVRIK
jgi:hypothetical protein